MAERKPGTTSHTDAVQALVEETRAMRARVPNLVIPSKGDRRRLAPAASVPPAFVELTCVAVRNSTPLVRGGLDPARTRDLMDYSSAYLLWADELEATALFVRHSAIAARNQAGSDALTTFALARRLAKRPENADLAPHVDDMRRALGRARKGKSKPAPEPTVEATAEPEPEDDDTTPKK